MSPSTDTDSDQFAENVLTDLLHRIEMGNAGAIAEGRPGRHTFLVSHAWTTGPFIHLVYTAPPSDHVWGLVRDTRESLINTSSWNDADDPALYYYLLDLEENWPGDQQRELGNDPGLISWSGDTETSLPERISAIANSCRYTASPFDVPPADQGLFEINQPRRYADSDGPLPRDCGTRPIERRG